MITGGGDALNLGIAAVSFAGHLFEGT